MKGARDPDIPIITYEEKRSYPFSKEKCFFRRQARPEYMTEKGDFVMAGEGPLPVEAGGFGFREKFPLPKWALKICITYTKR